MWASTFTLFKIAWRDIDPVAFTAVRFAAMFAFAVAVLILSKSRVRPRRADLPALAASGLTGYFLYQMGFVLGLDRTSALASAILISTHPIFSVIALWLVRREKPTRLELGGVLLSFLGVAVFLRAWDAFAAARPGDHCPRRPRPRSWMRWAWLSSSPRESPSWPRRSYGATCQGRLR